MLMKMVMIGNDVMIMVMVAAMLIVMVILIPVHGGDGGNDSDVWS
jgi:hypothetical protein